MIYDTLSNTALQVSKICLGTMTWGEQNTEAEAHEQLDYAVSEGINFIDTAEMYAIPPRKETQGLTESYIGNWLQKRGNRNKLVIASKIAGPRPGVDWLRPSLDYTRSSIEQALHNSLSRLRTDYLDLYQLHWPERNTNFFGKLGYTHRDDEEWTYNIVEVLQTMEDLITAGKIRFFGLSNETPWGVMKFLQESGTHGLPRPVSIQNPYSLLNRSYEVGIAEISMRENIGCLPYSPLAFGMLTGKYHRKQDLPKHRINLFPHLDRYSSTTAWKATEQYLRVADKYELSPAQLSLAFIHSRPFVTSTIVGATDLAQLKENLSSLSVKFTPDMLKDINEIHASLSNPSP